MNNGRSSLWKNFLLLGVSLIIAFAIGEIGLRLFGFYGVRSAKIQGIFLVEDEILDHRRLPNQSFVQENIVYQTNQHGWRDFDYDYEKPPGTFRWVVLGDSVSDGLQVDLEDIYSKQLERSLRDSGSVPYDVISLALFGLNSTQAAHLLDVEGLKYEPDGVILGYVLNDPGQGTSMRNQLKYRARQGLGAKLKRLAKSSSLIHVTYHNLQTAWWKIAVTGGLERTEDTVEQDYFGRVHRDPKMWSRVCSSFARIAELTMDREIPVVIVIFPVIYQLEEYRWGWVHDQLAELASEHGFHTLDLLEAFRDHDQHELQVNNGDYVHPNAFGHELAAQALFSFLREEGLMAPSGQKSLSH